MKITILDGAVENPGDLSWEALAALGDLTVYDYTAPEEILSRIGDAPIILTNKTPITRQTMDECPNLRYIGVLATGFNVIDIAAAKEKGIVVANVPSYGTQAVAQFVMAQLLEICHRIGHHNDAVQQGRWTACRDFSFWDYPLIELAGKSMGIIGQDVRHRRLRAHWSGDGGTRPRVRHECHLLQPPRIGRRLCAAG